MIFQIRLVHHVMHESGGILHSGRIGCGIGTVERQMEREVRIFFLNGEEVFQIKDFVQRTGAVEVRHLPIFRM